MTKYVHFLLRRGAEDLYESKRLMEEFGKRGVWGKNIYPDDGVVVWGRPRSVVYHRSAAYEYPDIVINRFGSFAEDVDLVLARQLHRDGVLSINPPDAISVARNKMLTYERLSECGIPIPNTLLFHPPLDFDLVGAELGWPCVVKLVSGSWGNGVYLCQNRDELTRFLQFIDATGYTGPILGQEYIGDRPGTDLRVMVVGGKVLGGMVRIAPPGEIRGNLTRKTRLDRSRTYQAPIPGGRGEVFEMTPEVEQLALKTASVLGLELAGIDFLFDSYQFRVCEANPNPFFQLFDTVTGINTSEAVVDYCMKRLDGIPSPG